MSLTGYNPGLMSLTGYNPGFKPGLNLSQNSDNPGYISPTVGLIPGYISPTVGLIPG